MHLGKRAILDTWYSGETQWLHKKSLLPSNGSIWVILPQSLVFIGLLSAIHTTCSAVTIIVNPLLNNVPIQSQKFKTPIDVCGTIHGLSPHAPACLTCTHVCVLIHNLLRSMHTPCCVANIVTMLTTGTAHVCCCNTAQVGKGHLIIACNWCKLLDSNVVYMKL